ncbi:MAG TPA: TonB-dependent receptor [Methylotenera sp.]|nr:TonB-dependent receptor [Methylotenera sp.]
MPKNKHKKPGKWTQRFLSLNSSLLADLINNSHPKKAVIGYFTAIPCLLFTPFVMAEARPLLSPKNFSQMSLEDLANIEITSVSRQPERILDAPAAVTVITNEDIRRSGATSIPEALRLADNLSVAQKNSHDWAISARGFNTELGNKLLVMIDGRTIYSPLFSGVFWDRQDYLLEDIDRIEVISGPGGTLWGANAVNGVINIITKKAQDTQGTHLEAVAGNELRAATAERYGGKLADNVSYRIYGKYFDRDDQAFGNGKDAHDGWHMSQGGFRIDADASSKDSFTVQGDIYGGREDVFTGGTGQANGGNILGRWTHSFSASSEMSLQMYYDKTDFSVPQPGTVFNGIPLAPAGIFKDALDTYDVDFQHHFILNDLNKIVWGLGYRSTHDVVSASPSLTFAPAHLDQELYNGFIQDEIKLHDKLSLTLGTKLEHNDYTGWESEPSARLQWKVSQNQLLWAAVSRAVRMPSRIDRDVRFLTTLPAPQNLLIGNDDFKSENVVAYELGYRAQLGPKINTSVTAFYNEYDDIRSIKTSTNPASLFVTANDLEGNTYGIEFSGSYQALSWWRLNLGYRYLEENLNVKPGQFDLNNGALETADPRHQVSLKSSMNLSNNVELDAQLRWTDKLQLAQGGTTPSYTELNVRLGWRPVKNVQLALVGQNLIHSQHVEYGFPGDARIEIERSIYGKVQWDF